MTLVLDGVWAGYGGVDVLRDVHLTVPAGSAVALLGANGAGKTTLLKAAAGLIRPRAGSVRLHGAAVERKPASARAKAGLCLVPEGRGVFRQLTVRENIAMQVHGRDVDAAVEKAATYFPRLGERLRQTAGTLSGGEQQMLSLARALVTDPTVVMADELSMGLAPVVVDEIYEAVGTLRSRGVSLLVVEQYSGRALALADYVYILHKGRVVFVGEPSQCTDGVLFARYLGESTAAGARRQPPARRQARAPSGTLGRRARPSPAPGADTH